MSDNSVHELAGGDLAVWRDEAGSIMLKVRERRYNDPVELSEEEALELAAVLTRLSTEDRSLIERRHKVTASGPSSRER